jgi:hypothetical protein
LIIGVFTAIAVARSPGHHLRHGRAAANRSMSAQRLLGSLHLNAGITIQADFQYSTELNSATQLRNECLHGTRALRFVG